MEGSALAQFVVANAWVFPTLETLHFLGLIILIGSLFVIDLRLLGLAARIPVGRRHGVPALGDTRVRH